MIEDRKAKFDMVKSGIPVPVTPNLVKKNAL